MECEDAANDHSYEPYSASNRTGADGAGYKDNRHNPYSHSEDSYAFCECESSTYTTSSLAASVVVEQTKYEVSWGGWGWGGGGRVLILPPLSLLT